MKKNYIAPALECYAFCSATAIGNELDPLAETTEPSFPWNDGELGWGWT